MPYFRYRGLNRQGRTVQGRVLAETASDARELLAARDYQIDDLEEQIPLGQVIERWLSSFRPVSLQELAVTSRQLALMVASGIAISRCLQFMANQPLSRQLSDAWKDIERRVHSGQSLSQAMRHYPHIFSEYYVGMIMAGESSGNFGECLDRISCCLEKEAVTRAKIRAALTYPSVIFALGGMITLTICHWLLPTLTASLFQGSNMVLPWPTKVLIMVTGFFQLPGMLPGVFICLGILGFLARQYFSTPAGKETLQSTMLQMPVLRKIQGKVLATHFCQTFSSLIRVGVPLTRCLQICSAVMGNVIVANHILKIEALVMEGGKVHDGLRQIEFFPTLAASFMELGEDTGRVPESLDKVAEIFESELDADLESATALLEPLAMATLGALVLFVILAVFLPLNSMLGTLG